MSHSHTAQAEKSTSNRKEDTSREQEELRAAVWLLLPKKPTVKAEALLALG